MLKPELWNSKEPWTYGLSRPPEAEMEAVKDQIRFIKGTGFQGHVHICHVSLPETIRIIKEAREQGLNISCEITPHHALLNEDKMREKDGLMYKVNPPLRKPGYQKKLKEMLISLIQEGVDWLWISTDYAPHTGEEKMKPDGPSGIADYSLYIQLLNNLMEKVLVPKMIEKFTYHNILKAFLPEFKLIPR
jgi:dihydroorotase